MSSEWMDIKAVFKIKTQYWPLENNWIQFNPDIHKLGKALSIGKFFEDLPFGYDGGMPSISFSEYQSGKYGDGEDVTEISISGSEDGADVQEVISWWYKQVNCLQATKATLDIHWQSYNHDLNLKWNSHPRSMKQAMKEREMLREWDNKEDACTS